MNIKTANEVIEYFGLEPLPEEGGFYKETYRDKGRIEAHSLPAHQGERCYSTCIYYLVTPEEFSGLHAVRSTEIFHFYAGDPVEMVQINEQGELSSITLGSDWSNGERPQVIVEPGIWQGTRLIGDQGWALMGCTVAPGFEFADFLIGERNQMLQKFPQHREQILRYTR